MMEISVLAPSPLFTITIESGPNGSDTVYFHAGGQGFWVARMIRNLGAMPCLCGPFGGETGAIIKTLIEVAGIRTVPVPIAGWNGGYVQDRRTGKRQTLGNMPSAHLNRHEIDDLYDAALAQGFHTGTLVLTGSVHDSHLPPEFYRRLAKDLGDNGVTVVADLWGAELTALAGGIDFLKVSHLELIDRGYCVANDRSDNYPNVTTCAGLVRSGAKSMARAPLALSCDVPRRRWALPRVSRRFRRTSQPGDVSCSGGASSARSAEFHD
jgi:1-phosphofructokinase